MGARRAPVSSRLFHARLGRMNLYIREHDDIFDK